MFSKIKIGPCSTCEVDYKNSLNDTSWPSATRVTATNSTTLKPQVSAVLRNSE
jgi:hypothetical protein